MTHNEAFAWRAALSSLAFGTVVRAEFGLGHYVPYLASMVGIFVGLLVALLQRLADRRLP